MKEDTIPQVVGKTLSKGDISKLVNPSGGIWKDQLCAVLTFIPVVGSFLAEEVHAISDFKTSEFCRKFYRFIYGLKDVNESDRYGFCLEIEDAADDYSGNVIMNLVDGLDNINKAECLANLSNAKILGKITIEDYFRLCSALNRIPYVDLKQLPNYQNQYYDEDGDSELLYSAGVLKQSSVGDTKFILSPLGEKLLKYGLKKDVSVEKIDGVKVSGLEWENLDEGREELKQEVIDGVYRVSLERKKHEQEEESAMFDFDAARGK